MKPDIITIGSATLDVFLRCENLNTKKIDDKNYLELEEKFPVDNVYIYTGGGATNTAATFVNMGFSTKVICALGNDDHGHEIWRDLLARGIKTSMIQIKKGKKSAYSVIISTGKDNRSIFVYRGASREIDHREVNWKRLNSKMIYITSVGGDMKLLSKAILTAKQKGIKIAFNPGSSELKFGLNELKDLLCFVDYLIINGKEAEILSGGSLFAEPKMYNTIKSCVKGLVVVTHGAKGAKIFDGKEIKYRKAMGKTRVDATGAGDAFGSGFAGMMLKTDGDIDTSFTFALKNSGSVITKLGAKNGLIKL